MWLVFWSMVAHSAEIRAVHFSTYGKYRAVLESLLAQLVETGAAPPFRLRPAAIALSALLDGFWIELSLSPTVFKPREAIARARIGSTPCAAATFRASWAAPRGKKADAVSKRRKA